MLTDDDLTRELGAAFESATRDLTYAGQRHAPRGLGAVALTTTAFAGVAAAAAVGVAAADNGSSHSSIAENPPRIVSTHSGGHAAHARKLVTRTMRLAGFSVTYSYPAGTPDPVFAELIGALPESAQSVTIPGTTAESWFGTDPATGDSALYLRRMTDAGPGQLFAILSPSYSEQQLIDLVTSPQPVPLTLASSTS